MLDHVAVPVADLTRSRRFHEAAFAPIGIGAVLEVAAEETGGAAHVGFGNQGKPYFWIGADYGTSSARVHVAFGADARADVDAFHAAALAAGGRDHGAPGPRPHHHAHCYGTFVLDPDGHDVEAVRHRPEG